MVVIVVMMFSTTTTMFSIITLIYLMTRALGVFTPQVSRVRCHRLSRVILPFPAGFPPTPADGRRR